MAQQFEIWQQILASPADEGLKTQFVAALIQTKDPRAEIFRLAAELMKYPSYYVQHDDLMRQYEASLAEWRAELEPLTRSWKAEVVFVQGWPIEITLAASDFTRCAAEIVATLPIRHLNLKAVNEDVTVFGVPQFDRIASLDVSRQPLSHAAIEALAASDRLHALRWLDFSRTEIEEPEIEILAASVRLREVQHLDLTHNPGRDPVDAAAGYGVDSNTNMIVFESIWLPPYGIELESRHGRIGWLHALDTFLEAHPPSRYRF